MSTTTSSTGSTTTVFVPNERVGFLEEAPGVSSSTRLVMIGFSAVVALVVMVWLLLSIHANWHKPGTGLLPIPTEVVVTLTSVLAIPATLKRLQYTQEPTNK